MTERNDNPISIRAYARHRGITHAAVIKAIQCGRLRESLVFVRGKPKIRNVDAADKEWAATTNYSIAPQRAPGASDADHMADVYSLQLEAAREKHWKAKLAELEYRRKAGELVSASEVQKKFEDVVRAAKTKLLGLPARTKQRLPHLSQHDIDVIDALVREALEDLADGR